jgi:hypothetical protein
VRNKAEIEDSATVRAGCRKVTVISRQDTGCFQDKDKRPVAPMPIGKEATAPPARFAVYGEGRATMFGWDVHGVLAANR